MVFFSFWPSILLYLGLFSVKFSKTLSNRFSYVKLLYFNSTYDMTFSRLFILFFSLLLIAHGCLSPSQYSMQRVGRSGVPGSRPGRGWRQPTTFGCSSLSMMSTCTTASIKDVHHPFHCYLYFWSFTRRFVVESPTSCISFKYFVVVLTCEVPVP